MLKYFVADSKLAGSVSLLELGRGHLADLGGQLELTVERVAQRRGWFLPLPKPLPRPLALRPLSFPLGGFPLAAERFPLFFPFPDR